MLHYQLDSNTLTTLQKAFLNCFSLGHYMVDLFIVISGFSLMLPTVKRKHEILSVWGFYKRRIIRIIPPYYFALIFSVVLIWLCIGNKTGTWWDNSLPLSRHNLLTHVLLMNDFFMTHVSKINHAMWSIPVECRIYILFPLILFVWKKSGPLPALILSVCISITLFTLLRYGRSFDPDINLTTPGVHPYLILFTLGMLAADMSFSGSDIYRFLNKTPLISFLLLSTVIFVLYKSRITFRIDYNGNLQTDLADILFGVVCFALLLVCSSSKYGDNHYGWIIKILSWPPLAFLGMFAYSIYLLHAPLLEVISVYLIPIFKLTKFEATVFLIIAGPLIIVPVSYVFFLYFEKPFLNRRKKTSLIQTEENAIMQPAP